MDYSHLPEISCVYSETNLLHSFYGDSQNPLELPEAHFEYEMILVTEGEGLVTISHKTYSVKRKSLIVVSRMERHHFVIHSDRYCRFVSTMSCDLILSNIKDVELVTIFIQRPSDFQHVVQLNDDAFLKLRSLFVRLTNEYALKEAFYVSRSASIVVAILIDLYRSHPEAFPSRSNSNMSSLVVNVQRYINDHYQEKITLQSIAADNYISRHALSIAFKDIVGSTFKDYLIQFRLTEAKKLLITTDLSIEEISVLVGYENVNNFIQIFRKTESLTPLQYRKKFSSLLIV